MPERSRHIVARGTEWEGLALGPDHVDAVYGRRLTWRTNDDELAAVIRQQVIGRWASLGVPHAGPDVSATAVAVPERYFARGGVGPHPGPGFTDFVAPGVGYMLVGPSGFECCAWDRRAASACVSRARDWTEMVDRLVQHIWSAAVMWHPPMYGLHAAAVVGPDGRASLLVVESRVGKSSLATYLALRRRFHYLTDDLTVLDGRSLVAYGRPWRVELREGALRSL